MTSMAGYTGTGTTMALSVSTWDTDVDIRDISFSGASRGFAETTHMNTTGTSSGGFGSRTFVPHRLSDPGEVTIDFLHNPDFFPPLDLILAPTIDVLETITITFLGPDNAAGALWVCDAFCTAFDLNIPYDGPEMAGTATFKLSGKCAVTADGA